MTFTRRHALSLPLSLPLLTSGCARPTLQVASPPASVRAGRLERLPPITSRHVDARPVDVWLPPGYDPATRRYAVLYMHDGQMLFDPASTWNKQAWRVDTVAARLLAEGKVPDFIVVGPWNNGRYRHAEYFPGQFLPHLAEPLRSRFLVERLEGQSRSDAYVRFLVEELKPAVDGRYATRPGREQCILAGSSMGGLISLYALCEYPQVFGGAGCLSTHWIGIHERNEAIPAAAVQYLREKLPAPDSVRLWMDRGDRELDALYDQAQPMVDALLAEKGFRAPRFVSRVYAGTGHNENAWHARLPEVIEFLLAA
jgi:predicted alpha/beta superfamily hydrolase